jgi:hypothetical protein
VTTGSVGADLVRSAINNILGVQPEILLASDASACTNLASKFVSNSVSIYEWQEAR